MQQLNLETIDQAEGSLNIHETRLLSVSTTPPSRLLQLKKETKCFRLPGHIEMSAVETLLFRTKEMHQVTERQNKKSLKTAPKEEKLNMTLPILAAPPTNVPDE